MLRFPQSADRARREWIGLGRLALAIPAIALGVDPCRLQRLWVGKLGHDFCRTSNAGTRRAATCAQPNEDYGGALHVVVTSVQRIPIRLICRRVLQLRNFIALSDIFSPYRQNT